VRSKNKVLADLLFLKLLGSALLLTLDFNAGFAQPQTNVECLAAVIMSEASLGTQEERVAIAWVIFNRVSSPSFPNTICGVALEPRQFATNQNPTTEILNLARSLISHPGIDPIGGATYFFSPISMPKEGDPTDGFDVGGGLHTVPGISGRVYFPSWTNTLYWVGNLPNIRQTHYMFFSPKFACHLYSVGSTIPNGVGVPWNVFDTTQLLLKASCTSSSVTADVGPATYVYNQGYAWTGTWTRVTLSCTGDALVSNAWCPQSAQGTLPNNSTFYAAYTCTWTGSQWKCGCRDLACTQNFWQLQGINR
jgi:Cell Wall Hydrolase